MVAGEGPILSQDINTDLIDCHCCQLHEVNFDYSDHIDDFIHIDHLMTHYYNQKDEEKGFEEYKFVNLDGEEHKDKQEEHKDKQEEHKIDEM